MSTLPAFDKLTEIAKQLNTESNQVGETIKAFEKRLNDLNIGLETWLDSDPLYEWTEEGDEDSTGDREQGTHVVVIGYAKYGDEWCVSVKTDRYVERPNPNGYGTETHTTLVSPVRPLRDSSREYRLKALPLLPKLLDQIIHEGEKLLQRIGEAKRKLSAPQEARTKTDSERSEGKSVKRQTLDPGKHSAS